MKKRNLPTHKKAQKIRRDRDPIPWRYCLMTLVCGLFLVVGFFFAARQHFASIEYGIKNSRLKKQLDELEAEKRRLILEKEIALTPAEIKKAAIKLGLADKLGSESPTAKNTETAAKSETSESPAKSGKPEKTPASKTPDLKTKNDSSNVVENKTAKSERENKNGAKPEVKKAAKQPEAKEKTRPKTGR